jgi:deoxyhypusine synthase
MTSSAAQATAQAFAASILVPSVAVSDSATRVQGPDFNLPCELQTLLRSYESIGFQATAFSQAIGIVERMVRRSPCGSMLAVSSSA